MDGEYARVVAVCRAYTRGFVSVFVTSCRPCRVACRPNATVLLEIARRNAFAAVDATRHSHGIESGI